MSCPVRLVIVENSPFINRLLLTHHMQMQTLHVAGTVLNGLRVIDKIRTLCPDVVTMDLDIANVDGLDLLDRIMYECPTSVVLVSDRTLESAQTTLEGITLGAVDFIVKIDARVTADSTGFCEEIVDKIYTASRIRIIRSLQLRKAVSGLPFPPVVATYVPPSISVRPLHRPQGELKDVIVIGASTGGPTALCDMLSHFPDDCPVAVIIVQHMPETFTTVLAQQLDCCTTLRVREVLEGDRLKSGTVLVAPGNRHLSLDAQGIIRLSQDPSVTGHRPSIDVTMQSAARGCVGLVRWVLC